MAYGGSGSDRGSDASRRRSRSRSRRSHTAASAPSSKRPDSGRSSSKCGRQEIDHSATPCYDCGGEHYRIHHGASFCRKCYNTVRRREAPVEDPGFLSSLRCDMMKDRDRFREEIVPWKGNSSRGASGGMSLVEAKRLLVNAEQDR